MDSTRTLSVSAGLRLALHALVAALVVLVLVRGLSAGTPRGYLGAALALAWALAYALGVLDGARRERAHGTTARTNPAATSGRGSRGPALAGVVLLSLIWAAAAFCLPEAAYLVFPLFFVQLHVLGSWWGPAAVVASTAVAIVAIGVQQDFGPAGAIGPSIGAAVALLIGAGYRALARQAAAREELLAQLVSTRDELARTQRLAGAEAERARLSRDIHDTVSQSLSSIQMLLHAAERSSDPDASRQLMRSARETAASAQEEARAIVRALSPAPLATQQLGAALLRLARTEWAAVPVSVDVPDTQGLPMGVQTALLRLAQGAVGNAVRHAGASSIRVTVGLEPDGVRLRVADDGVGFDPRTAPGADHGPGHFGLASMRERVAQQGGTLELGSAPGAGTTVAVWLPLVAEGDDSEPVEREQA